MSTYIFLNFKSLPWRLCDIVVDGLALEVRVVEGPVERGDDERVLEDVVVGGGVGLAVVHLTVAPPHRLGQRVAALHQADQDQRFLEADSGLSSGYSWPRGWNIWNMTCTMLLFFFSFSSSSFCDKLLAATFKLFFLGTSF